MTLPLLILLVFFISFRASAFLIDDSLFADARYWIGGLHPKLDDLLSCYWCAGTWTTLAALVFAVITTDVSVPLLTFVGIWAMVGTAVGFAGSLKSRL